MFLYRTRHVSIYDITRCEQEKTAFHNYNLLLSWLDMEIDGKTAVITGASGKLAGKIAIALAEDGANCLCHYNSNAAAAEKLVEDITEMGQKATAVQADLTEPGGIDKLINAITQFGQPAVLVNSASIFEKRSVEKIDFISARKTMELNLIAPMVISCRFADLVKTAKQHSKTPTAKIINLIDIAADRPWAKHSLYCASKAGLAAATKAMAKELAPEFCVNAVAPGLIDWPADYSEQEKNRQLAMIPAGKSGCAEYIISAVKFLIENDYVTGQVITVDGGRSV